MDAASILSELKARGYTYTAIANLLDFSCMHVSMVARRQRTNHRVATAIATALGKPIKSVFPDVQAYHRPYQPKDELNRELAAKLAEQNLIQRCA